MNWLLQNANVISALASTGMFLIWSIYAWLFYNEYRRQRGSLLFIHEAGGQEPNSVCVLVNLSQEPVHVLCSLAAVGDRSIRLKGASGEQAGTMHQAKQGPLHTGDSLVLGAFEDICSDLELGQSDDGERSEFEIRVAAIHGFREWPIGGRRRFRLDHKTLQVWPVTEQTQQLRSKRQARRIRSWIEACRDS